MQKEAKRLLMADESGECEKQFDPQKVRRSDLLFAEESYRIKGACLAVHNALGCGFLEKVYENALVLELKKRGFKVSTQVPLKVLYDGVVVGEYAADLLIDDKFILEAKATEKDNGVYHAQLVNYLKATRNPLGFLVNFGMPSLYFKRVAFTKVGPWEMEV
jgi:GxxExxY protein